ncbi:MAG: signal peptidase II [Elusimicrobia bacterium]|nr:signal peptidase II [Elusimicrobiota bacterium]
MKKLIPWIVGVVILDQAVKSAVVMMMELGQSIRILPFFHLTFVTNTGAAFGMFSGVNLVFIIVSLMIISILISFRKSILNGSIFARIGFVLIIGGACGNLIDRIIHGHVIDYLDFLIWPVFNIADTCICVGTGALIVSFYQEKKTNASHSV